MTAQTGWTPEAVRTMPIRKALEPLFARAPSVNVELQSMLRSDGLAMSDTTAVTLTDDDGSG